MSNKKITVIEAWANTLEPQSFYETILVSGITIVFNGRQNSDSDNGGQNIESDNGGQSIDNDNETKLGFDDVKQVFEELRFSVLHMDTRTTDSLRINQLRIQELQSNASMNCSSRIREHNVSPQLNCNSRRNLHL